jgi:hypothetical protein
MRVVIHEPSQVGGKASSQFDGELPGEHGFRFFAGWYVHLTHLLSRISVQPIGPDRAAAVAMAREHGFRESVRDRLVPVEYTWGCWAGKPGTAALQIARGPGDVLEFFKGLFSLVQGIPPLELAAFTLRSAPELIRFFFAPPGERHERFDRFSLAEYLDVDAASAMGLALRRIPKALVAMDGFAGSTATFLNASMLNQAPSWNKALPLDRVLNGPTSKAWLEPWTAMLGELGVDFNTTDAELESVQVGRDGRLRSVRTASGTLFNADAFVLALPIDRLREVALHSNMEDHPDFRKLGQVNIDQSTGWMVGMQLFLTTPTPLHAGHLFAIDSQYGLTAIDQTKVWAPDLVDALSAQSPSIRGLVSAIVTQWDTHAEAPTAPKYPLPSSLRDPAELLRHSISQLVACLSPDGVPLFDPGTVAHARVDANVRFGEPQENLTRMLIHPPGSWNRRPTATTSIRNLFLASDFIQNPADLATMEGGCAAASIAANAILAHFGASADVKVHELVAELEPRWLANARNRFLRAVSERSMTPDEALERIFAPNAEDALSRRDVLYALFNEEADWNALLGA